jgi:hypothetical protein
MLFKSNAEAACAKQAATQIVASNVQVFLTSTAIHPQGLQLHRAFSYSAHAVRADRMPKRRERVRNARTSRIPYLAPFRSYTGRCWRSTPAQTRQAVASICFFRLSKSLRLSVANMAQAEKLPVSLPRNTFIVNLGRCFYCSFWLRFAKTADLMDYIPKIKALSSARIANRRRDNARRSYRSIARNFSSQARIVASLWPACAEIDGIAAR